jgi:hypothetical protein
LVDVRFAVPVAVLGAGDHLAALALLERRLHPFRVGERKLEKIALVKELEKCTCKKCTCKNSRKHWQQPIKKSQKKYFCFPGPV